MQGRRVYPDAEGHLRLAEGDYGFNPTSNCWEVRPPGAHAGTIRQHTVTEHEDGTITVAPSILLKGFEDEGVLYHGFLERGIWREC